MKKNKKEKQIQKALKKLFPNKATFERFARQKTANKYEKELVGWVAGMQFKYQIKPNAWAATVVADKLCKS